MNKNIIMLARLYDNAIADLQRALEAKTISLNDPRIFDKVKSLGEIAKTLSAVYQIESMRAKPLDKSGQSKEANLALPDEQITEDPALKNAQKGQFKPNNTQSDLGQFHSPGGWTPFNK